MKRKINKHRRTGPPRVGQVFILTLIVFFSTVFFSLWIIDKGIEPTLMDIAETKTRQVARWAINEAVDKRTADELENENLVEYQKDDEGNIVGAGWNSELVNEVHRNTTIRVQNFLKKVENGEVTPEQSLDVEAQQEGEDSLNTDNIDEHPAIAEIPLGQATNNTILANLGPRIPVHFMILGDVQSDIVDESEPLGINGAILSLYVELRVSVRIVVPFSTDTAKLTQKVLVDRRVIHGDVPQFYGGGSGGEGSSPDVTVPYDSLQ
ncbi:sporulation protein YunB [Salinibacillus kushneri]|uniref:Sporulation protein YunB n=1 Tax=Salinibacillus kushneri TaxID=237682 RepID=A0A1H9Y9K0_9BACI|nr:sporulation protein YunB [Salinibacillus kushneri]SES65624.1 sporulation protein YunB [Salinibacillus kushneri]